MTLLHRAFDNMDNGNRNSVSGAKYTLDTAIALHQDMLLLYRYSYCVTSKHVITFSGCNVTSQIGTKESTIKSQLGRFLQEFREAQICGNLFKRVVEYQVNV